MLNIYFGDMEGVIFNPSLYFKNKRKEEWVTEPLSIKMIKDVDKSEVIAGGVIKSPVFGLMPPEKLSGGVKTLILINNEPDKVFNASACGDNCAKWILEISKNKDITINLRHIMDFGNEPFKAHVLNGDEYTENMEELFRTACKYI